MNIARGKFTLTMEVEFVMAADVSGPGPAQTGEGQAGGEAAQGRPTSAERSDNTSGTAGVPAAADDNTAELPMDDDSNVNNAADDVEEILLEPVEDGAALPVDGVTDDVVAGQEQAAEGRPPQQLLDDVNDVPLPNPGLQMWARVRRRLDNWDQSCTEENCGRCFIKTLTRELLTVMEVDEEQF